MLLNSVVFPEPLGPTNPVIDFLFTEKSTPSSATIPPKDLWILFSFSCSVFFQPRRDRFSLFFGNNAFGPIHHKQYQDKTDNNDPKV